MSAPRIAVPICPACGGFHEESQCIYVRTMPAKGEPETGGKADKQIAESREAVDALGGISSMTPETGGGE